MLLVIPSIEISKGKCGRQIQDEDGTISSLNPIEMAKLWRRENAKMLHITDLDGIKEGYPVNIEIVKSITKAIDVPIELGGGIRSFDIVKNALENGIHRVVIGTMFIENPDETKRCVDTFGTTQIVLGIDSKNYHTIVKGGEDSGLTPISVALNAKQIGFRRIIYTDVITTNHSRAPNFEALKLLTQKVEMRVTCSGGISNLEDLLKLQEMESLGIDSVIIGKALYENKFSCQKLWRICEKNNFPYTARL